MLTTTNEKGGGGWSLLIFNTKVAVERNERIIIKNKKESVFIR
jgi:hypothetical protein